MMNFLNLVRWLVMFHPTRKCDDDPICNKAIDPLAELSERPPFVHPLLVRLPHSLLASYCLRLPQLFLSTRNFLPETTGKRTILTLALRPRLPRPLWWRATQRKNTQTSLTTERAPETKRSLSSWDAFTVTVADVWKSTWHECIWCCGQRE